MSVADEGGRVEVTTSTGVERFEAPIVEDEELDASETAQEAGVAAATAGERELGDTATPPLSCYHWMLQFRRPASSRRLLVQTFL
jgi:hypothetical protein